MTVLLGWSAICVDGEDTICPLLTTILALWLDVELLVFIANPADVVVPQFVAQPMEKAFPARSPSGLLLTTLRQPWPRTVPASAQA